MTGRQRWQWAEGPVDVTRDHFELRYGSAEAAGWDGWLPVARVGPATGSTFAVDWILSRADPAHHGPVREVTKELDFYLVRLAKRESDPWAYLQHHCGSSANSYSRVHWGFRKRNEGDARAT